MDPISIEDLALLEVLQRIDQCLPLESGDTKIQERLVEAGLAEDAGERMHLTSAGVELCKSLQHRRIADEQAAKVLEARQSSGEGTRRGMAAAK